MNDQTTALTKRIGIMLDTESLSLKANCVATQFAFVAFDLDDPNEYLAMEEQFLPINPQLILNRKIDGQTILWWMKQSDAARAMFEQNDGNDFQELPALVQHFFDHIATVIEGATEVEVWCRGQDHDIPIFKSMADDLNLTLPWRYDSVRDLRTIMTEAGVGKHDVPLRVGLIPHHALSDCKYQIECLAEARRKLRASR